MNGLAEPCLTASAALEEVQRYVMRPDGPYDARLLELLAALADAMPTPHDVALATSCVHLVSHHDQCLVCVARP